MAVHRGAGSPQLDSDTRWVYSRSPEQPYIILIIIE